MSICSPTMDRYSSKTMAPQKVPDGWSDDDVGCGGVVPVRASVIG